MIGMEISLVKDLCRLSGASRADRSEEAWAAEPKSQYIPAHARLAIR